MRPRPNQEALSLRHLSQAALPWKPILSINVCVYIYMLCVYMYVCMYVCYVCMYVCMYVYVCIHIYIYVCRYCPYISIYLSISLSLSLSLPLSLSLSIYLSISPSLSLYLSIYLFYLSIYPYVLLIVLQSPQTHSGSYQEPCRSVFLFLLMVKIRSIRKKPRSKTMRFNSKPSRLHHFLSL